VEVLPGLIVTAAFAFRRLPAFGGIRLRFALILPVLEEGLMSWAVGTSPKGGLCARSVVSIGKSSSVKECLNQKDFE
jgi:hypothetical protein